MPDAAEELPAGLVTFLLTDVEGSTVLHERLGDAFGDLIRRHDELIGGIVRSRGGAVVKTLGDGVLAAFGDPPAAVRAAAEVRTAVAGEPWGYDVRVRIGLHTGPAQPRDGDYTALAVHLAARVCAAAHGGQVLVTDDVPAAVPDPPAGQRWTDLGAYDLRGFEAPVRLVALDDGTPFPAPRATPAARHNVPALRTSFVGREDDLAELLGLVAEHRLVSVLGPGGGGKTRLAYEVARRSAESRPDGAWVVLLADLPAGGDVAERVAATLGVRAAPGNPLDRAIAGWCAAHEALVVLDNCEHVTEEAGRVVDTMLDDPRSRVRVLVTSREPLRVAGEVSWWLPVGLSDADAVALFTDRARLADARLDLTGRRDDVAGLCRQLDGLPLAVELAAARVRQLGLDGLLDAVRDRVTLLGGRRPRDTGRQGSLRALLDWSHDLLPADERAALRRCAVFQASFGASAAARVCDLSEDDAADVLERLADRSLLQVSAGPRPAYRMLWTIRDYALDRLRESGEAPEAADRHATWVSGELVPDTEDRDRFSRADGAETLARYTGLHDDAVAALGHLADAGDGARLAALANALFDYWLITAAYTTAVHWLRLAGEAGDARALGRAGTCLQSLAEGPSPEAYDLLVRSCALARAAGDEMVLGECLARYGTQRSVATDGREGVAECHEVLALEGAADRDKGGALLALGNVEGNRGDYDAAIARYEEVVALGSSNSQVAIAHGNVADLLTERGELDAAERRLADALPLVEGRDPSTTMWLCKLMYRIALARGDTALAAQWLDRGLRTAAAVGGRDSAIARTLRALRAGLTDVG